jgi:hypothetical protein
MGGIGSPGLRQPWARISQRLRRNEFGWSFTIDTPMLQAEFSANAERVAPSQSENDCDSTEFRVALSVQPFKRAAVQVLHLRETNVTLRIETDSDGQRTTIRLIGRMRREHVEELKAQIKAGGPNVTLDLNEVSLVVWMSFASSQNVKRKASPWCIVLVI